MMTLHPHRSQSYGTPDYLGTIRRAGLHVLGGHIRRWFISDGRTAQSIQKNTPRLIHAAEARYYGA